MSCIGRIENYLNSYGLGIILYKKQKLLFIPNTNKETEENYSKSILPIGTIVEFEIEELSADDSLKFGSSRNCWKTER